MRRIITATLLAVLAGAAAHAEDFSGFYAGINAGHANGHERDRIATAPHPGGSETVLPDRAGPDLPPSAAASVKRAGVSGLDVR